MALPVCKLTNSVFPGAPNDNFQKNICSEDDFRYRSNFLLACLSYDFRTSKKWYDCLFLMDFYPKKVT